MKRWDMIREITNLIENDKKNDITDSSSIAIRVLSRVEELGMLPPEAEIVQNFGPQLGMMSTYANEWEDE